MSDLFSLLDSELSGGQQDAFSNLDAELEKSNSHPQSTAFDNLDAELSKKPEFLSQFAEQIKQTPGFVAEKIGEAEDSLAKSGFAKEVNRLSRKEIPLTKSYNKGIAAAQEALSSGLSQKFVELGAPARFQERAKIAQAAAGTTLEFFKAPETFEDAVAMVGLGLVLGGAGKYAPKILPALSKPLSEILGAESAALPEAAQKVLPTSIGQGRVPRRQPAVEGPETPVLSQQDIVGQLKDDLNLTIRSGKLGTRKASGITKIGPEVVRIREQGQPGTAGDIETNFHEIGHMLHKKLFGTRTAKTLNSSILRPFKEELLPIATKPNAGQSPLPEGFAEFVRLYIANEPAARRVAPNFYEFFEKSLDAKNPEAKESLLWARERFNEHMSADPVARVRSHISFDDPSAPWMTRLKESFKQLYFNAVNELSPIENAIDELTKGQGLPVNTNTANLMQLFRGWTGKADSFLRHGTLDINTLEIKGPSLKDILEPVKENLRDFSAYMVSRRDIELQGRGINTGFFPQDTQAAFGRLDSPGFRVAAEAIDNWQDSLLVYLRDSGVLSQKSYAAMKNLNRFYVPFYALVEDRMAGGTGKTFADLFNPVKRIRGSGKTKIDPLESMVKNAYAFINVAERNRVAQSLRKLAAMPGAGRFVEKVPAPVKGISFQMEEIAKQLKNRGIEVDSDLLGDVLSIFRRGTYSPSEGIVTALFDGKPEYYQLDKDIYSAMMTTEAESLGLLTKVLSAPAKLLRLGATTLSPDFSIRNPLRDQFSALFYSKTRYNPVVDFPRGLFHALNQDEMYWKWKISGGEHSSVVSMDRTYLQKSLQKVLSENGLPVSKRSYEDLAKIIPNLLRHPIEALTAFSEFGEEATRLGEFSRALQKTGLEGRAGLEDAALQSREVTLDFARGGLKTKALRSLIAFWNPQVIGLDKLAKEFSTRPARAMAVLTASITLPEIMLHLAQKDDPRIKELPAWQRDLFFIVTSGNMTKEKWDKMSASEQQDFNAKHPIHRIPGPFETKVMFGAIPRRILEWMETNDKEAFDGMANSLMSSLAPGAIPTFAMPLLDNAMNWNSFRDRPIVPKSLENTEPWYQGAPYTSEIAKGIGKAINYSPSKIDHLIYGYTGGFGILGTKAIDAALRELGVVDQKFQVEQSPSDILMLRAFSARYPATDAASIKRFYDNYHKVISKAETYRSMMKAKDPRIREYYEANKDLILRSKGMAVVAKTINGLHAAAGGIYKNTDMTPHERRVALDKIYLQMIEYARKANHRYGSSGKIKEPVSAKEAAKSDAINQFLSSTGEEGEMTDSDIESVLRGLEDKK